MGYGKRVGILTSGGDCPGLNAAIRAVVKCSMQRGWDVYGIPYGTDGLAGLADGSYRPEELRFQEHGHEMPGMLQGIDILQFLSGSILGSFNKGRPDVPEFTARAMQGYRMLELDALIVIGGDGSLDIIYDLAQQGQWPLIVIPKTIDNDVPFTERSIGFDTAVNTVTQALYDLTFTAASHDRVMVVQTMGRDAGHLALHGGVAGGADAILIAERVPVITDAVLNDTCQHIAKLRHWGRKFALVVVAEGVRGREAQKVKDIGDYLATAIRDRSCQLCEADPEFFCGMDQVDTRATNLGHIQRSGAPTSSDRLLANAFGKMAVDLIAADTYDQLVVWANGTVKSKSLAEVIPIIKECHQQKICSSPVQPNDFMVTVARSLGIFMA